MDPLNMADLRKVLGIREGSGFEKRYERILNVRAPRLLRLVQERDGIVFSALVYGHWHAERDQRVLSACTDISSLTRLAIAFGGRRIKVPKLEEVVSVYATYLGVYAARIDGVDLADVYGAVVTYLEDCGIKPPAFAEFQRRVKVATPEILKILATCRLEGDEEPTVLETLTAGVRKIHSIADEMLQRMTEIEDPSELMVVYQELTAATAGLQSFLHGVLLHHSEDPVGTVQKKPRKRRKT